MFFSENSIFFLLSLNFQLKTPCPPNQLKIQIEKEKFEFSEKKKHFPRKFEKNLNFYLRLFFFWKFEKISFFFWKKYVLFLGILPLLFKNGD